MPEKDQLALLFSRIKSGAIHLVKLTIKLAVYLAAEVRAVNNHFDNRLLFYIELILLLRWLIISLPVIYKAIKVLRSNEYDAIT